MANRFNLPKGTPLIATVIAGEEAFKCEFKRVLFKSNDPRVFFQEEMYLSSDHRFLTPFLFDSQFDPGAEEAKARSEREVQLARSAHPVSGTRNAHTKLTIFSDFQCPFCRIAANDIRSAIKEVGPSAIEVQYRYLPSQGHPWAQKAAEAVACAEEQSSKAFWVAHDFLFNNQPEIRDETLIDQLSGALRSVESFDDRSFAECVLKHGALGKVRSDIELAISLGVEATPTLFVNGDRIDGVVSTKRLERIIANQSEKRIDESLRE